MIYHMEQESNAEQRIENAPASTDQEIELCWAILESERAFNAAYVNAVITADALVAEVE